VCNANAATTGARGSPTLDPSPQLGREARLQPATTNYELRNLSPSHSPAVSCAHLPDARCRRGIAGRVRAGAGRRSWVEPETEGPEAYRGPGQLDHGLLNRPMGVNRKTGSGLCGTSAGPGVHRRRTFSDAITRSRWARRSLTCLFAGLTRTEAKPRPRRISRGNRLNQTRKPRGCPALRRAQFTPHSAVACDPYDRVEFSCLSGGCGCH
jgi:hypothetical protein